MAVQNKVWEVWSPENTEALAGQECSIGKSRLGCVLVVWLLNRLKLCLALKDRIWHRRYRENSKGSWGIFQQCQLWPIVQALTTSLFLNRLRFIKWNILFKPNILIISKWFNFEDNFYCRQPDVLHLLDSVLPLESSLQPALKFFTDYQVV